MEEGDVAAAELPPATEQQEQGGEQAEMQASTPSPAPPPEDAAASESAAQSSRLPPDSSASTSQLSVVPSAASSAPSIRRSASGGGSAGFRPTSGYNPRSRSRSNGSDHPEPTSELVLQLQRLCRRQRQRSEERSFVRDVERVLSLLQFQPAPASAATSATYPVPGGPAFPVVDGGTSRGGALGSVQEHADSERRSSVASSASTASSSSTGSRRQHPMEHVAPTLAELDALLDCIADLFEHRNPGVRALAFEVVQLCLLRFGERLTPALRRKIFLRLETHAPGDFLLRQKALRALTQDGRHLEPFRVELGWLLLRLLEQSDAQRDLLALIQSILRRSPRALDRDKVIAIASVVSARCDVAWGRRDLEACRRFVAFFHVLAAHDLAYAASTPACLRSLCCLVNADGSGTWAVLKLLLGGAAGFHVLRGLLHILENPRANSRWVLRGAVFFVGMSCWGSQRVARFDELAWAPILLALERALQCHRGFVIFEVILALQRLIKKFGSINPSPKASNSAHSESKDQKPKLPALTHSVGSSAAGAGASSRSTVKDKRLVMEWDIILRMFRALRPWVSMTDEDEIEDAPARPAPGPDNRRVTESSVKGTRTAAIHPASESQPPQLSVSIQQTRIPRELLDTLQIVEELVAQRHFAGDTEEFLNVLEEYLPHLSEQSMLFLLRQRAEAAHPGYHVDWLATLSSTMRVFFSCRGTDGDTLSIPCAVRLEALEVLQMNLWTSRNVCEDRVIEEVVIPTLGHVYEDADVEVRRRALGFVIEVARQLESVKFDSLLDILASAMTLSSHEDAQLVAASGIVSLFSSAFNHLPPARAVRMYDLLATTVETHRSCAVRRVALECLLHVCEARAVDGRLQWKDHRVRTSRFLFVSRRAVRASSNGSPQSTTTAWVPVARALRALLTLVSAEPDAELFRMSVRGIKTMLENRAVLADVDISEVAAKVVASINYRAFGRTAIADEVERLLKATSGLSNRSETPNEDTGEGDETVAGLEEGQREDRRRAGRPISLADADLLRSLHVSTQISETGGASDADAAASFAASLRATAALLAKTRFLSMGLELLQLLVSYETELHQHALHELIRCLVGTLDLRLAVAEKDLFAGGGTVTDDPAPTSVSAPAQEMIYRHASDASDPYVSGAPRGFTSRVFSRFQSSSTHGSLFHALSSSVSKSSMASSSASSTSGSARPSREDRARLQTSLRQLFEAEFSLLHTATTALSLLVLLAPKPVLDQLESVLHSARACITTVDGDFRADAFGAVLELLGAIVFALRGGAESNAIEARKAIVEILLLGFEYAKSKQLSYLAFRLLSQLVHQSGRRERVVLAELAMPTLQQCARRANSLLAEAAMDFLMCFAYSQSSLVPAALCSHKCLAEQGQAQEPCGDSSGSGGKSPSRSRSWMYKSSLLTITTTPRGSASLVIRRANCTNRWELSLHHELSLGSVAWRLPDLPTALVNGRDLQKSHLNPAEPKKVSGQQAGASEEAMSRKRPSALPGEARAVRQSTTTPNHPTETPLLASTTSNGHQPMKDEAQQVPVVEEESKPLREGAVEPVFSHPPAATSLPPLPAYDGIGGSPSYFCEGAQVHRQSSGSASNSSSRKPLRQSEGEDDREHSRDSKHSVGVIREDFEEDGNDETEENDENAMDEFVLDDSSRDSLKLIAETPSGSAPFSHGETITAAAAAADEIQAWSSTEIPSDLEQYDPMYLMMQLFDLTVENRPQLLTEGPSLTLALSVLDRTPEYETHKIGLLYVRDEKQHSEAAVLSNVGGSLRYLRFLRGLGSFTKLEGLPGYTGGLDSTNNSDGKFGLIYKDECTQIMFHVATMMMPETNQPSSGINSGIFASMKKKRHIGNDFVHVVFKECDEEYDVQTLSGQFNDVHIVIQPLNDLEYRTQVHVKPGIAPFGPLYGTQIVASSVISESVRLTCLNANLACQVFHQDLVGYSMNCEDRLKQIKQLGLRLASGDEWRLDS